MRLKNLELNGFKSFSKKTSLEFQTPIIAIVGPNGSGKSNVVEALRFVLGEQSMKSMRGKSGVDFIFKGSKNLAKASRATVTAYFDNSDKIFKLINENGENLNLNYDTISISREVYADGLNKYLLNNSEVRLKDINNLLTSVNIGSSGHHIISQGEADRILNASAKDRREMVEDALGLKIYQYRMKEAERKLLKTTENMKEISMLRRENAPHLNFLRKQVEKFEKAKEMKVELLNYYFEYLQKESVYLIDEKNKISLEKKNILDQLNSFKTKLIEVEKNVLVVNNPKEKDLEELETKKEEIQNFKNEIERKLGRIEGMIEIEERRKEKVEVIKSPLQIKEFVQQIKNSIKEAINQDNLTGIKSILLKIQEVLIDFEKEKTEEKQTSETEELKKTEKQILEQIEEIKKKESELSTQIEIIKKEISQENERTRKKEKERFDLKVKTQELNSALELLHIREENHLRAEEALINEVQEGTILVGSEILSYKNYQVEGDIKKEDQEELKKKIERIKIKLEDVGATGSADLLKEYEEMTERDKFLAQEMEDLEKSIDSLRRLMAELKEKIDSEFKLGIEKINKEFHQFFNLMFGGGTGYLTVMTEEKRRKKKEETEEEEGVNLTEEEILAEEEKESGVEISVSLPHKKVKELQALSGGERSLTSIALLFAMSQVNPPPFLVLDETDAALDEANSRKYGDMLEKLSEKSELIVVTHNRETMSRAGVLYGVTIGSDGASKLLSVKLDEAAAIAK